jgi:hypothetical protein
VPDEPSNPFEKIIVRFAEQLHDAPGAARLARLAKTVRRIPEPVLDDLAALITQLNDAQLVGDDIAVHLIEVGYCDAKYSDATEFTCALRTRLQRYIREPRVANNERGDLKERISWWRMALGRAAELCRWPAIVLMETCSGA